MKQRTLQGFEKYGRTTRRAQFLFEMDRIVPWSEVCAVIEPVYPKGSPMGGRPLERMVRIYFLQQWFNLSDPAVEEAPYDSPAMREFAGTEPAPDETTVCKFRHLLERHKLGKPLLAAVDRHLKTEGIKISQGTIVDATIISTPSSTQNKDRERDPEMHQTAKGKQWYFGMKAHLGVDRGKPRGFSILKLALEDYRMPLGESERSLSKCYLNLATAHPHGAGDGYRCRELGAHWSCAISKESTPSSSSAQPNGPAVDLKPTDVSTRGVCKSREIIGVRR